MGQGGRFRGLVHNKHGFFYVANDWILLTLLFGSLYVEKGFDRAFRLLGSFGGVTVWVGFSHILGIHL